MKRRVFVPGRIEVLGKHTDYAGGSSLLAATDRGFTFTAEPLEEPRIVVEPEGGGGSTVGGTPAHAGREATAPDPATWRLTGHGPVLEAGDHPPPGWTRYVQGVVERLAADAPDRLRGTRIAFRSTLPAAAGLSSSSALVTGTFLALDAVCGLARSPAFARAVPDRRALVAWLSAAERGGPVGTRGGSEDHAAILCAEPDRLVRYGFEPVRPRGTAPVPPGWVFAIGASGVVADKGGAARAAYNRLSDTATAAARAYRASGEGPGNGGSRPRRAGPAALGDALTRAGSPDALLDGVRRGARARGLDPAPLERRARHFVHEAVLVEVAYGALTRGDLPGFAEAANRSAEVGAELLDNQVPETVALARFARELGAPAASPFGAGFGGSVWALVERTASGAFLQRWEESYRGAFPARTGATFFLTPAAPPARPLPDLWRGADDR